MFFYTSSFVLLLMLWAPFLVTSLDLPKIKPISVGDIPNLRIDNAKAAALKSLFPNLDTEVTIPPSDATAGKASIKLLAPPLNLLAASDLDPASRVLAALNASVPRALDEYDRHDLNANEGVEAIKAALDDIKAGKLDTLNKRELEERGLWSWIKGAGCAIFAAAAAPGYFAASADLWVSNGAGGGTTDVHGLNDDILYHLFPLYSSFPSAAPLNIHYSATRPPGFGAAEGITVNRNIYTVLPPPPWFLSRDYKNSNIKQPFAQLLRLLIHETQHVKQYASFSYNLLFFAHAYLYEVCFAGSYANSKFEREAYAIQSRMDADLTPGDPANVFFLIWRQQSDLKFLGFPTEVGFRDNVGEPGVREKRFQNGVLQIRDPMPPPAGSQWGNWYCIRTFTKEEIGARDEKCTVEPIDMCVKRKARRGQDTRVHNKDGEPVGGPPDGRKNCKHPKRCDQINREKAGVWAGAQKRAWRCNTGLGPADIK